MLIGAPDGVELPASRRDGLIDPRLVFFRVPGRTRDAVFEDLAGRLAAAGAVRDGTELVARLVKRERDGCTGVGRGIAIPHCRLDAIDGEVMAFATTAEPVDFGALDGIPVDLVFLVVSPTQAAAAHLQAVARVSRLLRVPGVADALRAAGSAEALLSILRTAEGSAGVLA
jgi:PTS system nitrogen regulatory IIA component